MTKDFADFLESLNREGVAYVVIGGMAVLAHVPYRTTRDLDVLIEPTLENAHKARRAVAAWGAFDLNIALKTLSLETSSRLEDSCASRYTVAFPAWSGTTFGREASKAISSASPRALPEWTN